MDNPKTISNELYEKIKCFHANTMKDFGPDGHCDGSDGMVYGVLKMLGYEVSYDERFVSKNHVDKMIEEAMKSNE